MVTLEEMKEALGTQVIMTLFRKLHEIDYLASYSHRGKYYILRETARFDERGLWTFRDIHFSRFGSLVETSCEFISRSEKGLFAPELYRELLVQVHEPLLQLVRAGRVAREDLSGLYLYVSSDPARKRHQILMRRDGDVSQPISISETVSDPRKTRAAAILFFSFLNEKQRRLYAGLESLRQGRGGDRRVASLTGMDVHTIARGRRELLVKNLSDRLRGPGGGRPPMEKKARNHGHP
jgi:hypothetical protein